MRLASPFGVFLNSQVTDSSATKRIYKEEPVDSRKRMLILKTILAEGQIIRPLIIFEGKNIQSTWFQCKIPDLQYICSESTYKSNKIDLNWLKEIFLSNIARNPPRPCLLILDNHGSHTTTDFL
jgi:DDE superfamily endonuclease